CQPPHPRRRKFPPVPRPQPLEESRVPPDTVMASFEDVDLDAEAATDTDWLERNYRLLALGAGVAVLVVAIAATGWFVWSRLNESTPPPLPEPTNEVSE
ncbi:MAG: hypothetical protein HC910_22155, partial [Spirulinaceae cyanobacterium SM2_1_0]|nr:hypothetical protein [Spirulinaceae cyanobacterium SM2_1_0]